MDGQNNAQAGGEASQPGGSGERREVPNRQFFLQVANASTAMQVVAGEISALCRLAADGVAISAVSPLFNTFAAYPSFDPLHFKAAALAVAAAASSLPTAGPTAAPGPDSAVAASPAAAAAGKAVAGPSGGKEEKAKKEKRPLSAVQMAMTQFLSEERDRLLAQGAAATPGEAYQMARRRWNEMREANGQGKKKGKGKKQGEEREEHDEHGKEHDEEREEGKEREEGEEVEEVPIQLGDAVMEDGEEKEEEEEEEEEKTEKEEKKDKSKGKGQYGRFVCVL
ncbi:unnamed protein product [Closterium sp. Yama58-4]|nr:unnamed protein product [Closterium sp. Yama58-4]